MGADLGVQNDDGEHSQDSQKVNDKDHKTASISGMLFVIIAACSATFLGGYNSGVVAGGLLFIVPEFGLEEKPNLEGLITSIGVLGGMVGIFLAFTSLGRKIPLTIAAAINIVASALMFWSPNVYVLILGRFLVGYAGGMTSVNLPLYTAECAPASRRGFVVSSTYVSTVIGVLSAYLVDLVVTLSKATDWRWMVGAAIFPSFFMLACMLFLPESPRFLISRLQFTKARQVLERLRGMTDVEEEFSKIVKGIFPEINTKEPGLPVPLVDGIKPNLLPMHLDLNRDNEHTPLIVSSEPTKEPWWRPLYDMWFDVPACRALVTCICLEFFQQWSGIQAVIVYTPTILKDSGIAYIFEPLGLDEESSSMLATVFVYCIKIPFLFMGMYWIDHVGRRRILLWTVPVMTIALSGVAASFSSFIEPTAVTGAIIAFSSIMVFGCAYSPGLGSIPTLIESEIFPPKFRSLGLSVCTFCGALFNIFIVQAFPSMSANIGLTVTFFIFALISAIAFFFILFFIPETKQTRLEDVHKVLHNQSQTNNIEQL